MSQSSQLIFVLPSVTYTCIDVLSRCD